MAIIDKIVGLIRAARDLLLIALGFTILLATPPSLQDFGLSGTGAHLPTTPPLSLREWGRLVMPTARRAHAG